MTKIKRLLASYLLWVFIIFGITAIWLLNTEPVTVDAERSLLAQTSPISPIPGAPVTGTILLQGRTNHAGAGVFLTTIACPLVDRETLTTTPDIPSTTTDENGHFAIVPTSGDTFVCLQGIQHGYLVAQNATPWGELGTIELPGGDVTEDDLINIFDLAFIASRYQTNDPAADINADGTVNIFDLTITAGNYERQGPVTEWQ